METTARPAVGLQPLCRGKAMRKFSTFLAAQGGKGPRLSARLSDRELAVARNAAGPPHLLQRGPGAVEELSARYPF